MVLMHSALHSVYNLLQNFIQRMHSTPKKGHQRNCTKYIPNLVGQMVHIINDFDYTRSSNFIPHSILCAM